MYDAMAGYVYELDSDVFAETIPETYQEFLNVLEKHDVSTDDIALAMDCDDWNIAGINDESVIDEIEESFKYLQKVMESKQDRDWETSCFSRTFRNS